MSKRTLVSVIGAVCVLMTGCASTARVDAGASASGEAEPAARVERASSNEGREIVTRFIGDDGPVVLIIGGIHGAEPEGLEPTLSLVGWLEARAMPVRAVVIEDLNPDGSAHLSRYNARGVDLNRNWPASNFRAGRRHGSQALSEVETAYGHDLIQRVEPELVIVLHSIHSGPFVNYDGPASAFATAFARAADLADASHRWGLQAEMGYPTPGSIGSYVGGDLGIPILTIEFDRGHEVSGATSALLAGTEAAIGELVHGR